MTRIIRLFVVVLASAGSAFQGGLGSGTITPAPDDEHWIIYRNPQLGFELEVPAGWKITSTEPFGNLVRFQPPPSRSTFREFSFGPVQPVRDAGFQNFDEWLQHYKRELVVAGASIRSEERLLISGDQAVRLTYSERNGSTSSVTLDVLIAQPGNPEGLVFRFLYGPPTDGRRIPEQEAIYRRILSSLRIYAPK